MSENIFSDKNEKPDENRLAEKMGPTFQYWMEVKKHIQKQYGNTIEEWKFYGKKYGWQLKTLIKKRNLFFLIPYESYFKLVFVFGDKAVAEIVQSEISEDLKKDILNAKKYGEGRGLSIEVRDGKYLADIKKLIDVKMKN